METFTIREAAERCEVGYQAMRKRVDRGTIQTVKRDGLRLVPRAELERVGLWPGSQPETVSSTELATLRAELADARTELDALRPLAGQLDAERQARELAEHAMHEQRAAALTARERLDAAQSSIERLAGGNLIERWRARRELRAAAAPEPAPTAVALA